MVFILDDVLINENAYQHIFKRIALSKNAECLVLLLVSD